LKDTFFSAWSLVTAGNRASSDDAAALLAQTSHLQRVENDRMLVEGETAHRGQYDNHDLCLSLLQAIALTDALPDKVPDPATLVDPADLAQTPSVPQEMLAQVAQALFSIPEADLGVLCEQAAHSLTPGELSHVAVLQSIVLPDIPEPIIQMNGQVRCSVEVVAPRKTGRHKRDARQRVVCAIGGFATRSSILLWPLPWPGFTPSPLALAAYSCAAG
jgi:hypothetical protein